MNYLQLTRNLRRFAPRVEPKFATYIFNPKGIYDFKQKNALVEEALQDTFRGVEYPVLEFSVKKGSKCMVKIKDGYEELSNDSFVLKDGANMEDFLPQTDGCIKKLTYDKNGIQNIGQQYNLLQQLLNELISGLKQPELELWFKERMNFSIGNLVLKDGDKIITRGYFSKEKNRLNPAEKYHFMNEHKLITGYCYGKDAFVKTFPRLSEMLEKRIWLLDKRAKDIIKKQYGIGCSPKTSKQIASDLKVTDSRVREIVVESKLKMKAAKTFIPELNADLDNLGHILTDEERYRIYNKRSSIDINQAEIKIIKHNQKKLKCKHQKINTLFTKKNQQVILIK